MTNSVCEADNARWSAVYLCTLSVVDCRAKELAGVRSCNWHTVDGLPVWGPAPAYDIRAAGSEKACRRFNSGQPT
jgi:hypothetical protein